MVRGLAGWGRIDFSSCHRESKVENWVDRASSAAAIRFASDARNGLKPLILHLFVTSLLDGAL
jgi:hypothetical protein